MSLRIGLMAAIVAVLIATGAVLGFVFAKKETASASKRGNGSELGAEETQSPKRTRRVVIPASGDEHYATQTVAREVEPPAPVEPSEPSVDDEIKARIAGKEPNTVVRELVAEVKSETRDAVWARQTESLVREKLAGVVRPDSGVKVDSVYCGSVRCVVEGSAVSRRAVTETTMTIQQMPGMRRARVRLIKKEDGSLGLLAILAKDGFGIFGEERPN